MALTLVTGPAGEPVDVEAAKAHLRVDIDDDDDLIGGLIVAARQHVEAHTRRALMTQTWELVRDYFPAGGIRVPLPPLQSVESITYIDEDGGEGVVPAEDYLVDTAQQPGRIVLRNGASWPAVTLQEVGGVRVRFTAGYGDAEDVPQGIKQAILLLVGTLYENREDTLVAQGVTVMRIPFGVEALLMPLRVIQW